MDGQCASKPKAQAAHQTVFEPHLLQRNRHEAKSMIFTPSPVHTHAKIDNISQEAKQADT